MMLVSICVHPEHGMSRSRTHAHRSRSRIRNGWGASVHPTAGVAKEPPFVELRPLREIHRSLSYEEFSVRCPAEDAESGARRMLQREVW